MDIGKGDYVECVAGATDDFGYGVVTGQLYCVKDIASSWSRCVFDDCRNPRVFVCGQPHIEFGGWCPQRFRPIYRPKAELIESLKTKTKEPA
jgi:hypothetical protein